MFIDIALFVVPLGPLNITTLTLNIAKMCSSKSINNLQKHFRIVRSFKKYRVLMKSEILSNILIPVVLRLGFIEKFTIILLYFTVEISQ